MVVNLTPKIGEKWTMAKIWEMGLNQTLMAALDKHSSKKCFTNNDQFLIS